MTKNNQLLQVPLVIPQSFSRKPIAKSGNTFVKSVTVFYLQAQRLVVE